MQEILLLLHDIQQFAEAHPYAFGFVAFLCTTVPLAIYESRARNKRERELGWPGR